VEVVVAHEQVLAKVALVAKTVEGRECVDDEPPRTDGSSRWYGVVLRPFEPLMSYDGTPVAEWTADGDAYLPSELDSRLTQASSLVTARPPPPTHVSSSDPPMPVDHEHDLLRLLARLLKLPAEEELH
jgi:hypothetical protein